MYDNLKKYDNSQSEYRIFLFAIATPASTFQVILTKRKKQ